MELINLYFSFSGLFNGVIGTILGLFVFIKNPRSSTNKVFAFFCLAFASWSYVYIFWPIAETKQTALLSFQLLHIGASFTSISYLHFVVCWLKIFQKKKRIIYFGYVLAILISLSVFSDLFIKDVVPKYFTKYWPVPGIFYHFYLVMFFSFIIYASYLLFDSYKKSKGIKKYQIKIILAGMVVAFFFGSTNYFLFYNIPIPPYGNILASLFAVCTAYAITRYRFMDIKVVIKKRIVYFSLLIFALGISLFLIIYFYYFLKNNILVEEQVSLIVSVALLIILLPALQKYIKEIFNLHFNKEVIDFSVKAEKFATSINQATKLNELIISSIKFIKQTIKIEDIKFLIRDFRVPELRYICQYPDNYQLKYVIDLEETKQFFAEHDVVVREELSFLETAFRLDKNFVKRLKKFLDKADAQIMIPISELEIVSGYILLGSKPDKIIYSKEEIEFIKKTARELSGNLDRVVFYEETVERVRREYGDKN